MIISFPSDPRVLRNSIRPQAGIEHGERIVRGRDATAEKYCFQHEKEKWEAVKVVKGGVSEEIRSKDLEEFLSW